MAVSRTVEFIAEASRRVSEAVPGTRVCAFGHIGDGNIHYNLTQPEAMEGTVFMAKAPDFHRIVHDLVVEMGGSISAEHGIGTFKRDELAHYASATELQLMRTLKRALDPANIMNPGKILTL